MPRPKSVLLPHHHNNLTVPYDVLTRLKPSNREPLIVPNTAVAPMMVAETDLVLTVPHQVAMRAAAMLRLEVMKPPIELPRFEISLIWHERGNRDIERSWAC